MGVSAKAVPPLSAVVFLALLSCLSLHVRADGRNPNTPYEVVVVEGGEVDLPCVMGPTQPQDEQHSEKPRVIVWYKQEERSSFFSYDMKDPTNPRHWTSRPSTRGHLSLRIPPHHGTAPPMAYLKFTHADRADENVYRCRVHFRTASSLITYIKLKVLVPPSSPTVEVWMSGRWLSSTRETPTVSVQAGGQLRLRCSTSGGSPPPSLTWWRGGKLLMGTKEEEKVVGVDVVRSILEVTVEPEDAFIPIVCQASNTNLASPLRAPFQLLVLSPPEWVRVEGGGRPMAAGDSYIVECRTRGATPPPVITWSVGGETQMYASSVTDADGETVSRLRYLPKANHAGSHLVCTARPPSHPTHTAHSATLPTPYIITNSVKLNIMYKPEVELTLSYLEKEKKDTTKPIPFSPSSITPPPPPPAPPSPEHHQEEVEERTLVMGGEERKRKEEEEGVHKGDNDEEGYVGETVEGSLLLEEEGYEYEVEKVEGHEDIEEEDMMRKKAGEEEAREKEGIVLHCQVRANPPVLHVTWHKDGVPLHSTSGDVERRRRGGGVVVGELSVVIGKVERDDAGVYTCTAHNEQGATTSNTIHIRVIHGPECVRSTPLVYGAPRHHTLNLTCQVSAYPPPSGFTWAFKSPRGLLRIPSEMVKYSGSSSWISYTPRANQDYGDLLCWALAARGVRQGCAKSPTQLSRLRCQQGATWIPQRDPCVARVMKADRPDPPERCEVTKREPTLLTVTCVPAYDGGLPQTFYMRVFDGENLVANSTSVTSQATVRNLTPGTHYRLILWSANTHGISRQTTVTASTASINTTITSAVATSTTSSQQNGQRQHNGDHQDDSNDGFLRKLGPPLVAIVTVIVVLGIVLGVVLGILTRGMVLPQRTRGSRSDEDESEYEDQASTVRSSSRDTDTPPRDSHLSRLGRGNYGLIERLWRPTVRYDIIGASSVRRQVHHHVYDDPLTIKRGRKVNIEHKTHKKNTTDMTPSKLTTCCDTLSMTTSDLDRSSRTFSWYLPNSRILRNNIDVNHQHKGPSPRKPVRVTPPRIPPPPSSAQQLMNEECNSLDKRSSPAKTTRNNTQIPGLEFRLILVPETSKMLQSAADRDSRVLSYLCKDVSTLSPKFPSITEEGEETTQIQQPGKCEEDRHRHTPKGNRLTSNQKGEFLTNDGQVKFMAINGQRKNKASDGHFRLIKNDVITKFTTNDNQVKFLPPLMPIVEDTDDAKIISLHQETHQIKEGRNEVPQGSDEINKERKLSTNTCDAFYSATETWNKKNAQEPQAWDFENTREVKAWDLNNDNKPGDWNLENTREPGDGVENPETYESPYTPESSNVERIPTCTSEQEQITRNMMTNYPAVYTCNQLIEQNPVISTTYIMNTGQVNENQHMVMAHPVQCEPRQHNPEEDKRSSECGLPSHLVPSSFPLVSRNNTNRYSYHPYNITPLAGIKRGRKALTTPYSSEINKYLKESQDATETPQSRPLKVTRKPSKFCLTSLFNLSSSSNTSSSSSTSSSSWEVMRMRPVEVRPSTPPSPQPLRTRSLKRKRRGGRPFWRPRSENIQPSGLHHYGSPHAYLLDNFTDSLSNPPSPRLSSSSYYSSSVASSSASSTSSCFPYSSSTSSSTPISSFYSSENFISISASLSHSSSTSSFHFPSSSSCSSTSSPSSSSSSAAAGGSLSFSSFLSPSLTSPSSCSSLSLASSHRDSCLLMSHITPT